MPTSHSTRNSSATTFAHKAVRFIGRLVVGIWHGLSKTELSTDYMQITGKHHYGPK